MYNKLHCLYLLSVYLKGAIVNDIEQPLQLVQCVEVPLEMIENNRNYVVCYIVCMFK